MEAYKQTIEHAGNAIDVIFPVELKMETNKVTSSFVSF